MSASKDWPTSVIAYPCSIKLASLSWYLGMSLIGLRNLSFSIFVISTSIVAMKRERSEAPR